MEILGQNLRKLRTATGYTQRFVAHKLNCSPESISQWENARVEPSIAALKRLSELYAVSIDDMVKTPLKVTTTATTEQNLQ